MLSINLRIYSYTLGKYTTTTINPSKPSSANTGTTLYRRVDIGQGRLGHAAVIARNIDPA